MGAEEVPSSADSALSTAPVEDGGAETQDRFRWQHDCTAIDCLAMLRDANVTRVVCEVHEDYVVDRTDGLELVSCKHRELSKGPWTIMALCSDGGVAHLFSRWVSFPGVRLRLMTNGALKTGEAEAKSVVDTCEALQRGETLTDKGTADLNRLVDALLAAGRTPKRLPGIPETPKPPRGRKQTRPAPPEGFTELVEQFMRVITVRCELPGRAEIRANHVKKVAQPALSDLTTSLDHAEACYEAVVQVITHRNMATPLTQDYANWVISRPRGATAAFVQARSIYPEDIIDASMAKLSGATSNSATPVQRLQVKLQAGGIKPTRRHAAASLREKWLRDWRALRTGLPGDSATKADLENSILEAAGDIEARLELTTEDRGSHLYEALREKLLDQDFRIPTSLEPARENLLGVAMDLTAQCRLWFSEEFDVDAAIQRAARPSPTPVGGER